MLFILATILNAVVAASVIDVENGWMQFRHRFNKTYSVIDETIRYEIFSRNVKKINIENSKGHSYTLDIGPFTDLTFKEYRELLTLSVNRRPKKAWGNLKKAGPLISDDFPNEKDWTTENAVTKVKNQGMCGSCWAFSATGALEGALAVADKKLVSLSEEQIIDCVDGGGDSKCGGGEMDDAFSFVNVNGLCSEEDYSYQCSWGTYWPSCGQSKCGEHPCTPVIKPKRVTSFVDVEANNTKALVSAIARQPVAVAIEADSFAFQHYSGGVLTTDACGETLDHGVLAVGYGTENGQDFWKVKNSWGASWGDEGFVKLARNTVMEHQGGECGILQASSYPILESTVETAVVV